MGACASTESESTQRGPLTVRPHSALRRGCTDVHVGGVIAPKHPLKTRISWSVHGNTATTWTEPPSTQDTPSGAGRAIRGMPHSRSDSLYPARVTSLPSHSHSRVRSTSSVTLEDGTSHATAAAASAGFIVSAAAAAATAVAAHMQIDDSAASLSPSAFDSPRITATTDCTEVDEYYADDNADYQDYVRRWELSKAEEMRAEATALSAPDHNGRSLFFGNQRQHESSRAQSPQSSASILFHLVTASPADLPHSCWQEELPTTAPVVQTSVLSFMRDLRQADHLSPSRSYASATPRSPVYLPLSGSPSRSPRTTRRRLDDDERRAINAAPVMRSGAHTHVHATHIQLPHQYRSTLSPIAVC